jgi:hypothetical protein
MKFKNSIIIGLLFAVMQVQAQKGDSLAFDYSKPLFKLTDEQLNNKNKYLRYSVLTGYLEGVKSVSGGFGLNFLAFRDTIRRMTRISMFNLSIVDLMTHGLVKRNRIVLEVKDPSKYLYEPRYGDKLSWYRMNGHCYEFLLSMDEFTDIKILNNDLKYLFNVDFGIKKRTINTLVLVRTSSKDKIRSTSKEQRGYNMTGHFSNVPIDRIADPLGNTGLPPMVDETGYKDPVDLDLNINDWADLESVRKELQRYDLDLKEEKREVEVFVITEINYRK